MQHPPTGPFDQYPSSSQWGQPPVFPPPPFQTTCRAGTLHLEQGTVFVTAPLKGVLWSAPVGSILTAVPKSGVMASAITFQTMQGTYTVQMLQKKKATEFLALLNRPQVPIQLPAFSPGPSPTVANTPVSLPAGSLLATSGTGKPTLAQKWKASRKRTKVGIGCTSLFVLILALCTCSTIASANMPHASTLATTGAVVTQTQASTQQVNVVATAIPTQPPTPTSQPTQAPTPLPTATPVPTQPPTPTPVPTVYVQPTQAPAPTPVPTQPSTGVNGNPWGYDYTPGNLIYSPFAAFCSAGYFTCVSTFWVDTNGYVVECVNGEYSHSGGVRGACSRDGGIQAILYSH